MLDRAGIYTERSTEKTMKVAAIICVRMNSERLPGKALCVYDEATGRTNLECLVDRVRTSRHNPRVIIATGESAENDVIAEKAKSTKSASLFRHYSSEVGDVCELLDLAHRTLVPDADYIWRVMADNPLVDIGLVDLRLDIMERNKLDVLVPLLPEPTYAAQSSIWSREAWEYCAKHSSGSLLEHPGEYIYENKGMFRTATELGPESVYYQNVRTELDTPEDLEFFKKVFWMTGHRESGEVLETRRAMEFLSTHPDIVALNAHIQPKTRTTYLHGHHRARNFKCQNPDCGNILASKINEGLEIQCQKCGQARRFYP